MYTIFVTVFPMLSNTHPNTNPQTIDLSPLSPEDAAAKGLPSGQGAQWWGCWVDVPYSAAVLNFVFSDREQVGGRWGL